MRALERCPGLSSRRDTPTDRGDGGGGAALVAQPESTWAVAGPISAGLRRPDQAAPGPQLTHSLPRREAGGYRHQLQHSL